MLVHDIMSRDVAVVSTTATLDDCAAVLLGRGVGCVVVTDDDAHVGIVTQRDVLRAAHQTALPLEEIAVRDVMSRPVLTISPDVTVHQAATRFEEAGVKRLLVADGLEMLGVVTLTDVVRRLGDIRRETADAMRARDRWERERVGPDR